MLCQIPQSLQRQSMQSVEFCKQNADAISQLSDKILAAGAKFLDAFGGRILLSQPVFEKAKNAVSSRSVVDLAGTLRPFAANFSHPFSTVYWPLIDAANFLSDATGTRWPYMTTERRLQSLKFAFENIESFDQTFEASFEQSLEQSHKEQQ